jgi:hypothetical protein
VTVRAEKAKVLGSVNPAEAPRDDVIVLQHLCRPTFLALTPVPLPHKPTYIVRDRVPCPRLFPVKQCVGMLEGPLLLSTTPGHESFHVNGLVALVLPVEGVLPPSVAALTRGE